MVSFLSLVITGFLNRLRGGGFFAPKLPSRPLFYVAGAMILLAVLFKPLVVALAFGATFLFWGIWPWAHLYTLGRMTAEQIGRKITRLEATLLRWAKGNIHVAFFLRQLFVLPGLALAVLLGSPLWTFALGFIFAGLAVAAYELAWRHWPHAPVPVAEIIVGVVWGALIVI